MENDSDRTWSFTIVTWGPAIWTWQAHQGRAWVTEGIPAAPIKSGRPDGKFVLNGAGGMSLSSSNPTWSWHPDWTDNGLCDGAWLGTFHN